MEIFKATAKTQQSMSLTPKSSTTELQHTQSTQKTEEVQINQEKKAQNETDKKTEKIETQKQMDQLLKELNSALDPFHTSLRFGFDNRSDDFYVSVIETKTNHTLRRFPAEEAQQLLPKIQEFNGILFDQKG